MRRLAIALVLSGCGGAVEAGSVDWSATGGAAATEATGGSSADSYEVAAGGADAATALVVAAGGTSATTASSATPQTGGAKATGGSAAGGSSVQIAGGSSALAVTGAASGSSTVGGTSARSVASTVKCSETYRTRGECTVMTTTCGDRSTYSVMDPNTGVELVRFAVESDFLSYLVDRCDAAASGGSGSGGSGGASSAGGSAPVSSTLGGTTQASAVSCATWPPCEGSPDPDRPGECTWHAMPSISVCARSAQRFCSILTMHERLCYAACLACQEFGAACTDARNAVQANDPNGTCEASD